MLVCAITTSVIALKPLSKHNLYPKVNCRWQRAGELRKVLEMTLVSINRAGLCLYQEGEIRWFERFGSGPVRTLATILNEAGVKQSQVQAIILKTREASHLPPELEVTLLPEGQGLTISGEPFPCVLNPPIAFSHALASQFYAGIESGACWVWNVDENFSYLLQDFNLTPIPDCVFPCLTGWVVRKIGEQLFGSFNHETLGLIHRLAESAEASEDSYHVVVDLINERHQDLLQVIVKEAEKRPVWVALNDGRRVNATLARYANELVVHCLDAVCWLLQQVCQENGFPFRFCLSGDLASHPVIGSIFERDSRVANYFLYPTYGQIGELVSMCVFADVKCFERAMIFDNAPQGDIVARLIGEDKA